MTLCFFLFGLRLTRDTNFNHREKYAISGFFLLSLGPAQVTNFRLRGNFVTLGLFLLPTGSPGS